MKHPTYAIDQEIYHITPESPKGVIIDIAYYYSIDIHKYYVTFGKDDYDWYIAYVGCFIM